MVNETKHDRFKRVAEKRVQKILDGLKVLSNCANDRIYEWKNDDLKKMWATIDKEVKLCKGKFEKFETMKFKL